MFTKESNKLNFKPAFIASECVLVLFVLILFVCNCYPFGDNTFLMFDMKRQYVDYYSYLRSVHFGDNNLFYSFSTTLGSGIIGFFVYYLTSPFLILLSLFPQSLLPLGIEIVICIKMMLAAFIMNLFLQKFIGSDPCTIVCSISWALSSFIFAHSMNMMWIDVIILLPVVVWTFENLLFSPKYEIKGLKNTGLISIPYILSVFGIFFLNYYISYQVMIFLVLGMIIRFVTQNVEHKVAKLLQIGLNTLLGVLLDAAFLIPTALELANSPKDITQLGLELTGRNLSPFEVFSKLGTMAYDINEARSGGPQLFCGVLFVVLVVMFFFDRKVSVKDRIGTGILLAVLLISFCSDLLNLVWHAGMEPSGHPYRQAFIWIFISILCGCRMMIDIRSELSGECDRRKALIILGISLGIVAVIYVTSLSKRYDHIGTATIIVSWSMLIIIGVALFLLVKIKNRVITVLITLALAFLQMADISANDAYTFDYQSRNNTHMSEFSGTVISNKEAVELINDRDKSFFRMENLTPRQQNDSMQYAYNGVTHYSSAGMTYVRYFLQKLGFNDDSLYTHYGADNTKLADAILGIKYLISDGSVRIHSEYTPSDDDTAEFVYQNPAALPVAIGVNKYVPPTAKDVAGLNPFRLQEDIISRITGQSEEVFLAAHSSSEEYFDKGNKCCKYIVSPITDGELYMYVEGIGEYSQGLSVMVNDEFKCSYGNKASMKVLNLGEYKAGDTVTVDVMGDTPEAILGKAVFVTEDFRVIEDCYHKLASQFTDVKRLSSSHLQITAGDCTGLFMTIPYETGWKVSVDGINTTPYMVYDALMYVPINSTAEKHIIDMKFTPEGFNVGLIISIITLGVIILMLLRNIGASDEDR